MAESSKRKSDALEKRNAIAVFSRPEASGLPETAQFFATIRQIYLSQALNKARIETTEAAASRSVGFESPVEEDNAGTGEAGERTYQAPPETSD